MTSHAQPGKHEHNVAVSTLELLKKLTGSTASEYSKAALLQVHFDRLLNEELDLLVTEVAQIDVEAEREPRVWGPLTRGDGIEAVKQASALMRRRFAHCLLNHQREEDD